jgi:hypothetical protein
MYVNNEQRLSYTPPSGYTHVANLCPATCGSLGVGADAACGGSGVITPVIASVVTTTTTAELRTRIANAPQTGCDYYWGPNGPVTYDEDYWTIHCGNPTVIYLDQGTFLLTAQLEVRTNTNIEIVGHPGGSTLDAQMFSRIFNLDWRAALTLKNVTLINGRAADGGAIKLRSRTLPGASSSEDLPAGHYSRLAILGGAIRDCEATINGGAISAVAESALFGSAVGRGSPLVAASSASAPAGCSCS